jgi:NADPH:quinone reductase-like Zn-dependent oxidoreductase
MKAAVIDRHGGPDVLRYAEVPDPEAGPGEVLVDVHAASVNAADWQVRRGDINPDKQFPYILGRDFSGIVVGAGEGVDDLRPGDAVFAVVLTEREATYAERVAVDATIVAPKPAGFSHVEAAAMALTGPTAPRPARSDVTALRPDVGRKREHLARIAALHEAGVVAVPPIARFPLAEAAAAHRISEGRHLRGKLVLEVR